MLAAVLAAGMRPATAAEPPVHKSLPALMAEVHIKAEAMIPIEWLGPIVSIEQAEAEHPGITDDRIERFPEAARPFGFENARWEALKAEMKGGDVLRSFASPVDSWQHFAGRAGIALVRDGTVVDALVTRMN